jgi:predicted acetyltransferase
MHAERRTAVELIAASAEQEPILANLLELYVHDFSEYLDVDLGEDGRFGYGELSLYWREANRHPFLVRVDGKLGGLVLLKRGSAISGNAAVWDMVEFFVLRGMRRRGVGTEVAHQVWTLFPGPWEVRVMASNVAARRFWEHAIGAFAGKAMRSAAIEKAGQKWDVFSFESAPPA